MSHVAAVRELDEAVAAAMECEHAVSALKKAVADAKGAHRTSAFASEAVTARGAAEALVAAARRVDAAHGAYVDALQRLFEEHKGRLGMGDYTLHVE